MADQEKEVKQLAIEAPGLGLTWDDPADTDKITRERNARDSRRRRPKKHDTASDEDDTVRKLLASLSPEQLARARRVLGDSILHCGHPGWGTLKEEIIALHQRRGLPGNQILTTLTPLGLDRPQGTLHLPAQTPFEVRTERVRPLRSKDLPK